MIGAFRCGEALGGLLYNMLERPAFAIESRLDDLLAGLVQLGAPHARMSGSGSAFFALFDQQGEAESFAERVARQLQVQVHVVRTTECEHL